jgi:bifunctional NMN adenylyltransferase/nudix hydrolase
MELDLGVVIGRFEPMHHGHLQMLREALRRSRRVLVLIGSADLPRSIRNPWTFSERQVMIERALEEESPGVGDRLITSPLVDHLYNEKRWIGETQLAVDRALSKGEGNGRSIGLFGQQKDASSYYLHEFPQWKLIDVQHTEALSATHLRRYLFAHTEASSGDGGLALIRASVPRVVFDMLRAFMSNEEVFGELVQQYRFIEKYRLAWADAPYPPTFVTVDGVVIHSGHVLLVRRGAEPGRGLWALPGGFVGQSERLFDACLRELREETRLRVPLPALRGALKSQRVFDHPERSLRGRTITHAFCIEFASGPLPEVRGGDDAARAQWIPISEALRMRSRFFEDHFDILEYFVDQG